jgi:hypothetical protein
MDVNYTRARGLIALLALLSSPVFSSVWAQEMTAPEPSGPSKPAPRMADGHPDFSGYWKGQRGMVPGGNIAKDLPGLKLPLTPAGETAWKHNVTATVDPEALCIPGGIPRHNASGLPFEIVQSARKLAFLYWYSYYRLIPIDAARKHSEDPDPSFFGEELGRWEGNTLVIDSIGFKDTQVWADENGSPHSDALHVVERWTRPDADHIHVETLIEDSKFYTRPFTLRTRLLESPTTRCTNTRAARITSIATTSASDPDPSARTARAATKIPRRFHRRFPRPPRNIHPRENHLK